MAHRSGIELVAFDLGGVLITVEKSLDDAFFDVEDFKSFTIGTLEPSIYFERISTRLLESRRDLEDAFAKVLTPKNGIEKILGQLNVPFTFWSNINVCHFEHVIRTNTFLAEYQTHTSGLSFQLSEMKPSPAFFKKCLQKAGLRAEQIFFLDDSAENVMAARRLGIDAHQVRGIEEALNALYERDVILMPKGFAPLE
jgi:HAD superfamily hydrolase (TIGR01509 family)